MLSFSFRGAVLAALLGAGFGVACSAQTLASVDGHALTLQQVEAANAQAAANAPLRQQIVEQFIQQQLLADTVHEVPPALQQRIDAGGANLRRQMLAQLAADTLWQQHPFDAVQQKAAYASALAALPAHEYWVRWIVVASPDAARDVLDSLRHGVSFAELAVQRSVGANAELGGALGWQSERTLPAAVLGEVRKLKAGQVAGPIALDTGYGIVQLLAERATPKPTLQQLLPSLEQQWRTEQLQQRLAELRKAAKVEITPQAADAKAADAKTGANEHGH
ncbi:putative parvulin-type peptidyl-prolyl cis-trans isomerase precursor [mine drainage metagenome]|uniref:Putative parvulin-type peptidyl-prolyl cis-trans isomerase n=1 Tax=mine drainage metagenome TaxID=410659 RepID=A0A1J5QPD6_9ZZZZ